MNTKKLTRRPTDRRQSDMAFAAVRRSLHSVSK